MLIKGGTIIDGSGKRRFRSDIRVEGVKIKQIGRDIKPRRKERVIEAAGQFVVPGFVDIINRSDIHFSIFKEKGLRSFIKQGVTTILGGSCGTSLAPLVGNESIRSIQKWQDVTGVNVNWTGTKEFLNELARHPIALNFATLTGYSTMRRGLVGDYFGDLDENNVKQMEYLLAQAIKEGSFGMSSGLAYSHERIASGGELGRLLRVVKERDGFFAAHLRDEGGELVRSVEEVINLTEAAEVSSHIFHFKALGKDSWSEFGKALMAVEDAAARGLPIDFDIYPYARTASVLYLLLPRWVGEGGKKKVIERLGNEEIRAKIRGELAPQIDELSQTVIYSGNVSKTFIGKSLGEIAKNQGVSVSDALINVIVASEDRISGFLPISEQNIEAALRSERGFVASDGAGYRTRDRRVYKLVHPRSFGTFPRFLGKYVREKNIMGWEEAVRKITYLPAQKIGLKMRGKIEKDYFADIVIFDPKKVQDKATFSDPFQYAEGINHVIVNGGFALREGKFRKNNYGKVLRK